jgi:hypothetical protein
MRRLTLLAVAATCAGLAVAIGACGGGGSNGTSASDAGDDAPADQSVVQADTGVVGYPDTGPAPEASIHDCILSTADGGPADPVLLCSQETALLNLLTNAYTMGTGVSPGFSSQTPYTATTGHAWQDDLGLAASLGAFQCSALLYGDTMYLGTFDAVLVDLGKLLPGEVVTTGRYDGEIYFRLRNAAQAFSRVASKGIAGALDSLADGYARAIQASFVQTVPLQAPDAGVPDAGAATATVIGTLNAQNRTVSYAPSQAVMAAAALLDMAARATAAGDAGAEVGVWEASANGALAYLWARARDPVTGLFYQALITSGDAGHDQLDTGAYANDALLSDVQGAVALGLARAQAATNVLVADGGASAAPYAAQIETLVTALTSSGLFDGQTMAPQGSPPQAPPGAWMQGLVPSLGLTLTNQTTASSALLLGGYVRARSLGVATAWEWELSGLREALDFTSLTGVPWAAHSNLVSIVTDGLGDVTQVSYLAAASRSWSWAQAFSPSGADAGLEPGATSYSTAALNAMVEGVTQAWYGQSGQAGLNGAPPCAY